MLAQELFAELCIDDINFNGDVELMEDGTIVWSYKYEPEVVELEEGEEQETEEEFVEETLDMFNEDLDFIFDLLDEFDEDFDDFEDEVGFSFDGETLRIELYLYEDQDEE
jgi:hypothetical protein